MFEFATGIINAQNYYAFDFGSCPRTTTAPIVFVASLVVHILVKLPVMARAYRERGLPCRCATTSRTRGPSRPIPTGSSRATPPRRRSAAGLLGFVGAGSALLLLANAGQSIGGPLRRLALLAPRSGDPGPGPNGFQVNKTAAVAGVKPAMTGDGYRLVLRSGDRELRLTRADLLAMDQRTESLPIACVEGWTTTQDWTGVPLASFAELVGAAAAGEVLVESLQARRHVPAGDARAHPVRQRARAAGAARSTAPTSRSTTGSRPG